MSASLVFGRCVLCGFLLLLPSPGFAEPDSQVARTQESVLDVDDEAPMDRIVVLGSRSETNWLETPASISIVDEQEIQRAQQQLTLGEALGNMPGVFIQNRGNFAQDARISIRGFGARTPFGIRGIKLIVDGIPLTLPDGQGQVDSLDLSTAARIEVLRGPAASLYGSSAGGVIEVTSSEGDDDPFARGRIDLGSYDFRSYQAQAAGRVDDWSYAMGLSRTEVDGYRDNSRMENVLLNTKFTVDVGDQSKLTLLLNHANAPEADDPGGLTAEEVSADRRQANQRNVNMKSGEALENTTVGLVLRHEFDPNHETTLSGYVSGREFDGRTPSTSSGAIEIDRFFLGGHLKHAYRDEIFGHSNRLTAGVEVAEQLDDRTQRAIALDTGKIGAVAIDELQKVTNLGAFIQDEFMILENLELSGSVRYDWVRFDVEDDFTSNGDDSDQRNFNEWSFAGALAWSPYPVVNPYLSVATAFETPTTNSFANPVPGAGGLNDDLTAQTSTHFELGSKGIVYGALRYEVAAFYIRVKDELLPYNRNFRTFYENAESSDRIGFELGLDAQLHRDWRASMSYTHSKFEFDKFKDGNGNRLDGKRIPGVPRDFASLVIDYESVFGWFASFEVQYVGARDANNANSVEAKDYVLANLRAGLEHQIGNWALTVFAGVNNLSGQKYIDNLRINDDNARFFEPAPGRNAHGGASVSYHY